MIDPAERLSTRVVALAALVCFAPVVISFAFPRVWWIDYPGILFHLAMFLLVAKLPAPDWAKAAGYGWLLLDVATGVMTLNNIPYGTAIFTRLGGHVFAGIWFFTVSLSGSRPVMLLGMLAGLILFAYTFASPFLPLKVLAPTSPLELLWLAIVAWQNGSRAPAGAPRQAKLRPTNQ